MLQQADTNHRDLARNRKICQLSASFNASLCGLLPKRLQSCLAHVWLVSAVFDKDIGLDA